MAEGAEGTDKRVVVRANIEPEPDTLTRHPSPDTLHASQHPPHAIDAGELTHLLPSVPGPNTQAYVVPKKWDSPPSAANVRVFLKVLLIRHCGHCPNRLTACASVPRPLQDHLPPYAIPSVFCAIDCLPVNASAAGWTCSVFRGVPRPSTPLAHTLLPYAQESLIARNCPSRVTRLSCLPFTPATTTNAWSVHVSK